MLNKIEIILKNNKYFLYIVLVDRLIKFKINYHFWINMSEFTIHIQAEMLLLNQ